MKAVVLVLMAVAQIAAAVTWLCWAVDLSPAGVIIHPWVLLLGWIPLEVIAYGAAMMVSVPLLALDAALRHKRKAVTAPLQR